MNVFSTEDIAKCISSLISRNNLWQNKNVKLFFITNDKAGCFTNIKKAIRYKKIFNQTENEISLQKSVVNSISYKIFSTKYAKHEHELTLSIVSQILADSEDNPDFEYIIVTAGGDGTSLEVQASLYFISQQNEFKRDLIKNRLTILRLPLGTGNDGTDGHNLFETIELLKSDLTYQETGAISVHPEKPCEDFNKPCLSFNIASIGLDGYVVNLTNKIKSKFPGNLYHLAVPLAGFLYDKEFPIGEAKFELFDKDENLTQTLNHPITLFAFGLSGHRVYGGGHKVLPNEENICIIPKITLLKLMKVNGEFQRGEFIGKNYAFCYSAEKVKIHYDKSILLQCDGEPKQLNPEHFPIIMEKTKPCFRILTKKKV